MKNSIVLLCGVMFLISCGGSMSDEQRKEMLEAGKLQRIQKITEAEIFDLGLVEGRKMMTELPTATVPQMDSIGRLYNAKIQWLSPGDGTNPLAIEQQLIEAYINSIIDGTTIQDNIQNIGLDSLLYTKAVVLTKPDSSVELKGTWNVWMSKKQLILSANEK